MKKRIRLLAAPLLLAPLSALAGIIIDNTTLGLYNNGIGDIAAADGPGGILVDSGDPTIYTTTEPSIAWTAAFGADWLGGDYSGGSWSGPGAIPTSWTVGTETAIVYEFSLATASDLHIDVGVDNGILMWLNGDFLFGATAPGGTSLNEYDWDIAALGAGTHSLQILRADHGGQTSFAIQVDASASVPEPTALLLLGTGLLGFGLTRRRAKA